MTIGIFKSVAPRGRDQVARANEQLRILSQKPEFTFKATEEEVDMMGRMCKETARAFLSSEEVAKGSVAKSDWDAVCSWKLNNCLQVHEDVHNLVCMDSEQFCNS
jgi:ABC-type hemin transport system ATPase subunit